MSLVNETSPASSQRSSKASAGAPRVVSQDRALPEIPGQPVRCAYSALFPAVLPLDIAVATLQKRIVLILIEAKCGVRYIFIKHCTTKLIITKINS